MSKARKKSVLSPEDRQSLQEAASCFETAARQKPDDSRLHLLHYRACKQLGNWSEARSALRRIHPPDATVFHLLGLLSLTEKNWPLAEEEFAQSQRLDPTSPDNAYNLFMTWLTLGKVDSCRSFLPELLGLLEKRNGPESLLQSTLVHLQILLTHSSENHPENQGGGTLASISSQEELRLLNLLRQIGNPDVLLDLIRVLHSARPESAEVRKAYIDSVLLKSKRLVDKGQWTEAELLLEPLLPERDLSRDGQTALLNMLGCCAAVTQNFARALTFLSRASKLAPKDPRVRQNLALVHEYQEKWSEAQLNWDSFLLFLDESVVTPEAIPGYLRLLRHKSLNRLASQSSELEAWSAAINYLQRACSVIPEDTATLEKLFNLFMKEGKLGTARRTLDQMRKLEPENPQFDLFELDFIEVKGLNDVEKLLGEIDRIRRRFPDHQLVDDRAAGVVGNVLPLMGTLSYQLSEQLVKVIQQVRDIPNYNVNWSAVREVMQDLLREFLKLRRIVNKCLPLVGEGEPRQAIRDLLQNLDSKIEACRSMGV